MAEVIPAAITAVVIPVAGITDLIPVDITVEGITVHITAAAITDRITAVITGTAAIMAGVAVTTGGPTAGTVGMVGVPGGDGDMDIPTIRITATLTPTLPIRTLPTLLSITRLPCRANRSNPTGTTARIRKVITHTSQAARVGGHRYSQHRPSQERRV